MSFRVFRSWMMRMESADESTKWWILWNARWTDTTPQWNVQEQTPRIKKYKRKNQNVPQVPWKGICSGFQSKLARKPKKQRRSQIVTPYHVNEHFGRLVSWPGGCRDIPERLYIEVCLEGRGLKMSSGTPPRLVFKRMEVSWFFDSKRISSEQ